MTASAKNILGSQKWWVYTSVALGAFVPVADQTGTNIALPAISDELSVDIDDRDQIEGSYFINVTPDKGFFSKLLASASITKTYQLILKEYTNSQTRVIFVDLSEENDEKTISYSTELFDQIASKF